MVNGYMVRETLGTPGTDYPSGTGDHEVGSVKFLIVDCPYASGGHEVGSGLCTEDRDIYVRVVNVITHSINENVLVTSRTNVWFYCRLCHVLRII